MVRHDFLVLLCHLMYDVPVKLFSDRDAAVQFAKQQDGHVPENIAKKIFLLPSSPNSVKVVDFENGEPVRFEVVKDFWRHKE